MSRPKERKPIVPPKLTPRPVKIRTGKALLGEPDKMERDVRDALAASDFAMQCRVRRLRQLVAAGKDDDATLNEIDTLTAKVLKAAQTDADGRALALRRRELKRRQNESKKARRGKKGSLLDELLGDEPAEPTPEGGLAAVFAATGEEEEEEEEGAAAAAGYDPADWQRLQEAQKVEVRARAALERVPEEEAAAEEVPHKTHRRSRGRLQALVRERQGGPWDPGAAEEQRRVKEELLRRAHTIQAAAEPEGWTPVPKERERYMTKRAINRENERRRQRWLEEQDERKKQKEEVLKERKERLRQKESRTLITSHGSVR